MKQYINTTKSKNKIKTLQEAFTRKAAPVSMTQMVYTPYNCNNMFIKKALETINKMNNIANCNFNTNLQKIKNQEKDARCIKPYLEFIISLDMKAYFTHNKIIKPYLNLFYSRNIKTMEKIINEIRYPLVAQGFINRETIKAAIPKQILEGLQICQERQNKHNNKQGNKNA